MRNLILVAIVLSLFGCTSRTDFGPCVGAFDARDPAFEYKLSIWNTVLAVVFVEMILPPIFVIADETVCPVGPAQGNAQ